MKELLKSVAALCPEPIVKDILLSACQKIPNCKPVFFSTPDTAVGEFSTKGAPTLVFVDWNAFSPSRLAMFFQRFRRTKNCATVSIIVIMSEMTDQALSMTAEYGVSRLLLLENISKTLPDVLKELHHEMIGLVGAASHLQNVEKAKEKNEPAQLALAIEALYAAFPDHPRAKSEYASLCIDRGDWYKAKSLANSLITSQPANLRAINLMSRVLLHEGKFDEMLSMIEKAEMLSPQNIDRLIILADAYVQLEDNDKARAHYLKAIEIDPNCREAKIGVGKISLAEGQVNQALEFFRDSASESEIASFFNNTAIMAVRRKEFQNAVQLYPAALNSILDVKIKARIFFNMGLAYRKWDKPQEAEKHFAEALKLDPTFMKAQQIVMTLADKKPAAEIHLSENQTQDNALEKLANMSAPHPDLSDSTRSPSSPLTTETSGNIVVLHGQLRGEKAAGPKTKAPQGNTSNSSAAFDLDEEDDL